MPGSLILKLALALTRFLFAEVSQAQDGDCNPLAEVFGWMWLPS